VAIVPTRQQQGGGSGARCRPAVPLAIAAAAVAVAVAVADAAAAAVVAVVDAQHAREHQRGGEVGGGGEHGGVAEVADGARPVEERLAERQRLRRAVAVDEEGEHDHGAEEGEGDRAEEGGHRGRLSCDLALCADSASCEVEGLRAV
jgi:hypothetical protein